MVEGRFFMNDLSPEVKIMIVNGQALVDKCREHAKEKRLDLDMTCRFQIRDDCKAVENNIKMLCKGKKADKYIKELELSIIRLKTTAEMLLDLK